jgi:hypothetical protein
MLYIHTFRNPMVNVRMIQSMFCVHSACIQYECCTCPCCSCTRGQFVITRSGNYFFGKHFYKFLQVMFLFGLFRRQNW